jgi:phenylalanyl-tRNA synthetase beta chain
MKVSIDVMKWYSGGEQWRLPLHDLVARIGRQLGAVEETTDLAPKYAGAVIARVVSCRPHPNSDHLHICTIDDGGKVQGVARDDNGFVQVVCGAPNVREGLLVVWLPPGATVPESYGKEPFVLGAREFRGEMSNGMLASARELDINDDHEGILELDDDLEPGTSFAAAYGLNDAIIDIENKMFTHRPDCFGNMGVAREIAGIQNLPFSSPEWYAPDASLPEPQSNELPLVVTNELPQLVPRFVAVPIAGVTIGPSPLWMQIVLRKLGIRPINNVVDITNYYMVLTGQPLHAYDYDKVKALSGGEHAELVVRHPTAGEKIVMLNGKELVPYDQAMMVASGDTLVGVGGMIGGANSEVSQDTTNIILEAATWDMYTIRRTSMHHGIFTDAVTRFSKGQSPLQNTAVVAKATAEILSLTGGKVAGKPVDDNHVAPASLARGSVHAPITTTSDFINARLGTTYTAEEMAVTLNNAWSGADRYAAVLAHRLRNCGRYC